MSATRRTAAGRTAAAPAIGADALAARLAGIAPIGPAGTTRLAWSAEDAGATLMRDALEELAA